MTIKCNTFYKMRQTPRSIIWHVDKLTCVFQFYVRHLIQQLQTSPTCAKLFHSLCDTLKKQDIFHMVAAIESSFTSRTEEI